MTSATKVGKPELELELKLCVATLYIYHPSPSSRLWNTKVHRKLIQPSLDDCIWLSAYENDVVGDESNVKLTSA